MKILQNNTQAFFSGFVTVLLLLSGFQTYADPKENQINYSPDHWPSRWSSAIHKQQTGRFPKRDNNQNQPAELPEAVSGQDLFYSYSGESQLHSGEKLNKYDRRYLKQPAKANEAHRNVPSRINNPYRLPHYQNRTPYMVNSHNGYSPVYEPAFGPPGTGMPYAGMPYAGMPYGGMPYGGMPYGGMPYGGMPYGGMPYGGTPYGGMPYGGTPYGGMPSTGSSPFGMFPFGGSPYGNYGNSGMWNPFSWILQLF